MKLITELNESVTTLVEEKEGKKHWFVEGIILQANLKNRNGRVYPLEILEREVERYTRDYMEKNRAVGELGHPEGPSINLDRISHKFVELRREGNNFVGKAQLMDTKDGIQAQKLLEGGMQLGISSRGMGSLKEVSPGLQEVQEDYYLATAGDLVADPSAPEAWVNGIYEGVDFFWNNGGIISERAAAKAKASMETAVRSRSLTEEKKVAIMAEYLRTLLK